MEVECLTSSVGGPTSASEALADRLDSIFGGHLCELCVIHDFEMSRPDARYFALCPAADPSWIRLACAQSMDNLSQHGRDCLFVPITLELVTALLLCRKSLRDRADIAKLVAEYDRA